MIFVRQMALLGALIPLLTVGSANAQKTPKDLIQYIEDAKQLGLKENEIRKNAVAAGWNKELVAEAFAIVNYLTESEGLPKDGPTGDLTKSVTTPEGYRIGAGDSLQILVWKEPDASVPTAVVRPDGKITLPMIREVEVAGLTPVELEKSLTEKLAKFIRAADVTVIVKGISGQRIYMAGAVRREGPVILESAMTVLQAINIAGGLTDYAKKKKIYILRNENGRPVKLPFDYQAVINGDRPELNILLRPNDMIVVP
jgi:polysaccharide export outer membrane protein